MDDDLQCEICPHEKFDHGMYKKSVGNRTEMTAKCNVEECDCSGTPKELFGVNDSEISEEDFIANEFEMIKTLIDTVTDRGNAISGKKTKTILATTEIRKLFGTITEQEIRDIFKETQNSPRAKFLNLG